MQQAKKHSRSVQRFKLAQHCVMHPICFGNVKPSRRYLKQRLETVHNVSVLGSNYSDSFTEECRISLLFGVCYWRASKRPKKWRPSECSIERQSHKLKVRTTFLLASKNIWRLSFTLLFEQVANCQCRDIQHQCFHLSYKVGKCCVDIWSKRSQVSYFRISCTSTLEFFSITRTIEFRSKTILPSERL